MGVSVVNVGEMFMLMGEHQMTMLLTRQQLDSLDRMMRVTDIDRMRIHEHLMRTPMPVPP